MALFDYQSLLNKTQVPQQNQYLSGDPSTQNNANTLWMDPNKSSSSTGINGGGGMPQVQQSTPPSQVQNGTMLGSIAAGNVGQYMPGGYDQAKFNDPSLGTSTKYQVGRILSKYPPSPDGLRAASQELSALGITVIGKDTIKLPDGTTVDVGNSFSDPNAQHTWQYNWSGPLGQSNQMMPGNSMFGQQQGNNQFSQNNMMNQIWQAMQARRSQFGRQELNPTGGQTPLNGGWGGSGNPIYSGPPTPYAGPSSGNTGVSGQIGMNPQPQFNIPSMLGLDPNQMYNGRTVDRWMNPQAGDMVSNGWGGMKPYNPNFTGIA